MRPARSAAIRSASTTIGPREVLIRYAPGLHKGQFARGDESASAIAELDMNRDDVGETEQTRPSLPAAPRPPPPSRRSGSDSTRSPACRMRGRTRPSSCQSVPSPNSPSVRPARFTPTVLCHSPSRISRPSRLIWRTVAIISPQVSSGVAVEDIRVYGIGEIGIRYDHPVLRRRRHVEIRQRHSNDCDQLQIGQSLEQAPRQTHPLANCAEHFEWPQRDGGLLLRQMPLEDGDLRLAVKHRPVSALKRNFRVIIEDSELDHAF